MFTSLCGNLRRASRNSDAHDGAVRAGVTRRGRLEAAALYEAQGPKYFLFNPTEEIPFGADLHNSAAGDECVGKAYLLRFDAPQSICGEGVERQLQARLIALIGLTRLPVHDVEGAIFVDEDGVYAAPDLG